METIFEQIGGTATVEKLVTCFYQHVLSDPLLSPFFEHTSVEKLTSMQVAFFTIALGGPEPSKMPSLLEAHRGRGIESRHLTRFTELLMLTLEDSGIQPKNAQKIYQRIATYSNEVLGETSVDG